MTTITESIIEQATLDWFRELKYSVLNGPNIAPGELFAERSSYSDIILENRLRSALVEINPSIPAEAIEDAYRKLTRTIHESPLLYANNHRFHKMLADGIDVEYRDETGRIVGDKVWLIDFNDINNNDWLIVNQFTVVESQNNRRTDIVIFLNGLPLGVIELKNPADENATIKDAFNQLQTYKKEIPSLFPYNGMLVVSDGIEARAGTLTADWEWFLPWRTIEGEDFPKLSDRRNIVVIADEAHRSQYDFIDGFARHMRDALPNASFIGFTGTPIEAADKNTPAVFGNYISIYDIQRAVEDGATVRIYYEARLARLELKEEERPRIDPEFEEVTEGEEVTVKEKLKRKWAQLEAMVGTEKRIGLVAKDIIDHFEKRLEAMDGKGMIVCMSRRICVDLYTALINLRPEWHHEEDDKGFLKVVMTGSASDPVEWQQHIRNKVRRERLAKTFSKKPEHPFKLVIVRDMWLTGFDVPCLHTMYIDKPMRGHGLMQAIVRVNRVFKDKPGGLVVDYLGIADELKKALSDYTERDRDMTGIPQEEAVAAMLEKYEIVSSMLHGFDYSRFFSGSPAERLTVIKGAMEHFLLQDDGRKRFMQAVTELSKAFVLSVPHEKTVEIRDHVGFFQTARAAFSKNTSEDGKRPEMLDSAVKQIVSKAIASDEVIDIFASAGLKKPDISILSDEFLEEIRHMPQRNLALEVLKKLLNDEIRSRSRKNLVQSKSFAEMLEQTIRKYQNRTIDAAKVILELIELAKEMREAHRRGEKLNLTEEELAFYDALETNDSAVKVLGDETLRNIARELVKTVRKNVTIDWTVKESVKAKLRTMVKRILRKYGYPPDKREKATLTVLSQAELLCKDWSI